MPFSYRTFDQYTLNVGQSINFSLTFERTYPIDDVFIEFILTPDTNINDIGIKKNGYLYLCCNTELFGQYGCCEDTFGELIIPHNTRGLVRSKILFEAGINATDFEYTPPISVDGSYIFAVATCDPNLEINYDNEEVITFYGTVDYKKNESVSELYNLYLVICCAAALVIIGFLVCIFCHCRRKRKMKGQIGGLLSDV